MQIKPKLFVNHVNPYFIEKYNKRNFKHAKA